MTFQIISMLVPTIIFFGLPKFLKANKQYRWLIGLACIIFFISWYLPSPLIDGRQTQFTTHFVGGGIFSGLLWLYIKLVKKRQSPWLIEALSLYALVSLLGVANELFELVLYKLGKMPLGIADTSWDLLANTSGAVFVYGFYVAASLVFKTNKSNRR